MVAACTPLLLILALLTPVPAAAQDTPTEAAIAYLQAYFDGDLERVVALLHSKTVARNRRALAERYADALATGREVELHAELGLEEDIGRLLELDGRSLYLRLISLERQRMEGTLPLDVVVAPRSVREIATGLHEIELEIRVDTPGGYEMQVTSLDVADDEGQWRVLQDSPEQAR